MDNMYINRDWLLRDRDSNKLPGRLIPLGLTPNRRPHHSHHDDYQQKHPSAPRNRRLENQGQHHLLQSQRQHEIASPFCAKDGGR